jgi:hypothetical protein
MGSAVDRSRAVIIETVGAYRGLPGPTNIRPKRIPSASTPPAEPPAEQLRAKRRKAS